MQNIKKFSLEQIELLFNEDLPELNLKLLYDLAAFINNEIDDGKLPVILYIPDIEKIAHNMQFDLNTIYVALQQLSIIFENILREVVIFKNYTDELFFILNEQELKTLAVENIIYSPFNPKTIYINPIIHKAFIFEVITKNV